MPEDTIEKPLTQETPPVIPVQQQSTKALSPEDDPNLKMQRIVSRRAEKKEDVPKDKPEDKPKDEKKEPGDTKALSGHLSDFLGFKKDKGEKKPEDKKTDDKKVEEEKKGAEKVSEKPAEAPKTIVRPKKSPEVAQDPVKVAAAAATAAVKAVLAEPKTVTAQARPEDSLKAADLREYEVAKYLAETNPRYKDAPKIVLEHLKKAEVYASRWEQENKGKVFNPDDEEHNEFYEKLEKPWSDDEFQDAKMEMAAERASEKKTKAADQKIKELETENARIAMTPVVERTYIAAAIALSKKMGDGVHESIVQNGFEKFSEEDDVTAGAMANAIGQLHPIIEAAIQLDDPKLRFPFDQKNPVHMEWNRLLLEKEQQLSGTEDSHGRSMVSRSEYAAMTEAQRVKHWYLTAGDLINELVNDAAETAKKEIEKENARLSKLAEKRGYVLQKKSDTPKHKEDEEKPKGEKEPVKPASPSSAGGSKIDDKTDVPATGNKKLLETTAGILFSRGS